MIRRYCLLFLLIYQVNPGFSQTTLVFKPNFSGAPLLGRTITLPGNDSIQFETFRFYISGIELMKENKVVWKEENSFHLLDAAKENTLNLPLKTPAGISYDKIKFNLGIDSTTNVSGALDGDLDPTKGMYWTWQSGYINLKLEGKSNLCKTRNQEFQFHLGGYLQPFCALQTIILETDQRKELTINVDVLKWIQHIDLSSKNQVMSPCKESALLAGEATKMFTVKK